MGTADRAGTRYGPSMRTRFAAGAVCPAPTSRR
ncbi:hypothetical protein SAMN05216241_101174 [Limimonas halophila]|uniref:Uncharacterized protein n=1 Tax=Limimonas halophila TaxID=1082479 RepID=A0A1G7LAC1_9PROT|nr:hypothetical protein SAMN05216241_101174 [Limimonas halophila]